MAWRWGLWAPRILQIPLFRNPKGRRLLRVPQFGPQNPAMMVLKSPGTPYRACVRRAFWRYHYLRAFSGVDTRAPGIKSDWCMYGIHAVYGCLAVFESHTSGGGLSSYGSSRGPFPSPVPNGRGSYERGLRSMLVYRLELFQLKCIISLSTWSQ